MTSSNTDARFSGVFVHASACIDEDVSIGSGTKIWHYCHVSPGSSIGENASLGQNVMVGPRVRVGAGCKIQNNVSLYEGVELEENVFCGPSCVFTNVKTPRAAINRKSEFLKTVVKRGATIGANATVLCGLTIGEFALIGAGAIVTRDVAGYALMVGAPARRVGWVSQAGEKLGPNLICPRTGERYKLTADGQLTPISE